MPADRSSAAEGLAALAVAALAVCCGLPVLLSVAAGVTVAGVGLGSWILVVAGVAIAVAAGVWWRRRRNRCEPSSEMSRPD